MHHRADRLPLRQAVVAERREALSERGCRRRPERVGVAPSVVGAGGAWHRLDPARCRMACADPAGVRGPPPPDRRRGRLGGCTGHPTRATPQPTAARLVETVQEVTRTVLQEGRDKRWHLMPRSPCSSVFWPCSTSLWMFI